MMAHEVKKYLEREYVKCKCHFQFQNIVRLATEPTPIFQGINGPHSPRLIPEQNLEENQRQEKRNEKKLKFNQFQTPSVSSSSLCPHRANLPRPFFPVGLHHSSYLRTTAADHVPAVHALICVVAVVGPAVTARPGRGRVAVRHRGSVQSDTGSVGGAVVVVVGSRSSSAHVCLCLSLCGGVGSG